MDKRIKILLIVAVILGIIAGAFLLFAKKKPLPVAAPKTVQATAQVKPSSTIPAKQDKAAIPKNDLSTQAGLPPVQESTPVAAQDRKILTQKQWIDCKGKTIAVNTNLTWSVQITEGIPAGGTYAKGNLDGDNTLPVHVIIKSDSKLADKIKAMLVVGKTAFLRGNCTDVATDGSVVLQAF